MSSGKHEFWPLVPKPSSRLARYRVLSPLAGIHVSPLQLGGMNIGDKWEKYRMGRMDKTSSLKLLDAFYGAGGNFIDTASHYQDQRSEESLENGRRGEGSLTSSFDTDPCAFKYSSNYQDGNDAIRQQVAYAGNNVKSMHISVEASLRKLRTSYIDILHVAWWDWHTSVEEVMNGLHVLVQQGKVLYLGISDAPAWFMSKVNQVLETSCLETLNGISYQWPAPKAGLALAPWLVLAARKFRTDEEEERRQQTGEKGRLKLNPKWDRNEKEIAVSATLEKVAKEVGTQHITAVAIAYTLQKAPYVFPIIGGRKVEHLEANLECLAISLAPEQEKYLESIVLFAPGFLHIMVGDGTQHTHMLQHVAYLEKNPLVQAIVPDAD